jgi:hypothetical protein
MHDTPPIQHGLLDAAEDATVSPLAPFGLDAPCAVGEASALLEVLDQFDDAVFDALHADATAVNAATEMWTRLKPLLSDRAREETREKYLELAVETWQSCRDREPQTRPESAVALLDLITLLLHG